MRNLSILSIIPLEDFRREVEASFDYTDQGVERGSCYYYSRVLNREPWETHSVTRCPGGVIIAHGFNESWNRKMRNFQDQIVTELSPHYHGPDGERSVYKYDHLNLR